MRYNTAAWLTLHIPNIRRKIYYSIRRKKDRSQPKCSWHLVSKVYNNVTDLANALPGKSSVNMVQHAIQEAVFSVSVVMSHDRR
jgi:hypothetical protein